MRIVVGGFLGLLPAGGVTWDYVQYPLGLKLLGHDVYYIEDTRLWPIYQASGSDWADASGNVQHLSRVMEAFGFQDRWAYRDEATGRCFGMPLDRLIDVCRTADLFLNISCSTFMRDEYLRIPTRILVDSDPMFTQIQYLLQTGFTPGKPGMRELLGMHTHHFTFGENVGQPGCRIPACGFTWLPTRQPIVLSCWPVKELPRHPESSYTTLMNWTAAPPIRFENEFWGQKDAEFRRYLSLPGRVPGLRLSMAINQTGGTAFPASELKEQGWQVLDPAVHAPDWWSYRRFIQESRGEFSVAKESYVKGATGWFSCRSACYLASGRPVITQETGWSGHLPEGSGLLAFHDLESAVEALRRVEAEPLRHARAARAIAAEHFDSARVLPRMLDQAECG